MKSSYKVALGRTGSCVADQCRLPKKVAVIRHRLCHLPITGASRSRFETIPATVAPASRQTGSSPNCANAALSNAVTRARIDELLARIPRCIFSITTGTVCAPMH